MYFTVEEENLICLYHNADRRRTAANLRAALPDMDKEMAALACQTADKLDAMSDADFAAVGIVVQTDQVFFFHGEIHPSYLHFF